MSDLKVLDVLSNTIHTHLVSVTKTNIPTQKSATYHLVYTAAKVQVVQKLVNASHCKHAYQVEVIQQFNLSSYQPNKNQLTKAPAMPHTNCIIHISPHKCNTCPTLIAGSTYLIAGQYHVGDDRTVMWELPNAKSQSLVSEWKGKAGENYNKKLLGWIDDANAHRLQTGAN